VVENDDYLSAHDMPNSGAPQITGVYDVADKTMQTPLREAKPGQWLSIAGQNLNNLTCLKFNNVDANLGDTYTQLTKTTAKVPEAFSKSRQNIIEYTTDMGTAQYAFTVVLPAAQIGGLENEFSTPGSDVTIEGKNLKYYDFTLTLNGEQLPMTVQEQQLAFRIPQGTPDNSTFVISWINAYGQTETVEIPFRHTDNLLFDDLTQTVRKQTDKHVAIETAEDGTKCLHFQGIITQWAWVELSFAAPVSKLCDAESINQYNFVFEVQTASNMPLLDTGYEFAWNWHWNNSYQWAPGENYDTKGQWRTVRCPLEQMPSNAFNTTASELVLNIGFQPYKNYEADFRLANFRIEKK
jgi:hypothetical protein